PAAGQQRSIGEGSADVHPEQHGWEGSRAHEGRGADPCRGLPAPRVGCGSPPLCGSRSLHLDVPSRLAEAKIRGGYREVPLGTLVRGAVLAARKGNALARGPLARARVTRQWTAVERDALLHVPVHVLLGERHVMLDYPIDVKLAVHGEVHAYVPEQRARR